MKGDNLDSRECLKDNRLKATRPRIKILELIANSTKPLTAMEICEILRKEITPVDLSTVYRTLEVLHSYDIISKFDLGDGKYNYRFKEKNHKHLIQCDICHRFVEIDCPMPQIQEYVRVKTGVTLLDACTNLNKGICKECSLKAGKY